MRFKTPFDRNLFLKSITKITRYRKGPLRLADMGFESNTPLFVKENLTPRNFKIYLEVLKLWKERKIASVYSRRGFVYAKLNRADQPFCIENLDDISILFRQQSEYNDCSTINVNNGTTCNYANFE